MLVANSIYEISRSQRFEYAASQRLRCIYDDLFLPRLPFWIDFVARLIPFFMVGRVILFRFMLIPCLRSVQVVTFSKVQ